MTPHPDFRSRWIDHIQALQDRICRALEEADGEAVFREDRWERPGGGGGRTRIIQGGPLWEKGGVNTSVVHGSVSAEMRRQLSLEGETWFAAGLSLVIHPLNPFVPTVHANWRYFELYGGDGALADQWFGGGVDLTPYYLFEEDAAHFHGVLRRAMDPFGPALYPAAKHSCDEYFDNTHRGHETRGIGGVFYDYLRPSAELDLDGLFGLQQAVGGGFLEAYLPIVARRRAQPYTPQHRYWQEIRRGRYVEFNLIHDRGTVFGLKTGGRTESILMSLPPTARFDYDYQPAEGSPEAQLLDVCRHPRSWA